MPRGCARHPRQRRPLLPWLAGLGIRHEGTNSPISQTAPVNPPATRTQGRCQSPPLRPAQTQGCRAPRTTRHNPMGPPPPTSVTYGARHPQARPASSSASPAVSFFTFATETAPSGGEAPRHLPSRPARPLQLAAKPWLNSPEAPSTKRPIGREEDETDSDSGRRRGARRGVARCRPPAWRRMEKRPTQKKKKKGRKK